MFLTSAFSKGNSAISLGEWVLVLKVFTTATRKLRVKGFATQDGQKNMTHYIDPCITHMDKKF